MEREREISVRVIGKKFRPKLKEKFGLIETD